MFAVLRAQMRQFILWSVDSPWMIHKDGHGILPWCMSWELANEFPDWIPWKVLMAKADKLIKRGLMDGCTCGCRGDFNLLVTNPYDKDSGFR